MQSLYKLLLLALAGALGTLARFALASLLQRRLGHDFPWGTAGVNLLGCFGLGFAWALLHHHIALSPELRIAILVGFMGAFTTFSTYIFETRQLALASQWLFVFLNAAGQFALGMLAMLAGLALGRSL